MSLTTYRGDLAAAQRKASLRQFRDICARQRQRIAASLDRRVERIATARKRSVESDGPDPLDFVEHRKGH